ncbi:hypothetical protein, partial [Bradyrhizobium sp. NBAIM08]|uniref:hypothetical protein n=1 Tax=Bradyrhizobium sp. NBAIM08 TaxID=2793815 RepID=UPI001CD48AD1
YGPLNLDAVIATSVTDPYAAADPGWARAEGPIVVGVSGHRTLAATDDVADRVGSVLDVLARRASGTELAVVSALAEGADRVVAAAALDRGARLEALLPLEIDDYRSDFTAPGSIAEFDACLERAESVAVTG